MQPYQLTLAAAAQKIKAKELSPVELTTSVLAHIEQVNPQINAFSHVTADLANTAAAQAEDEIAAGNYRGPLHGIPFGIKDLYDTAGVATTAGSKVRANHMPTSDSTVMSKLRTAGAVMVGKTHTHEFAYGVVTPQTHNPWELDHIAGGSSGGSAAAVAAGACFVGMGTDTAGSIRIPASLCGIVGLKPTYGRVSRAGVTPFAWSLDHVGPLTRTVNDAALVMNAIAGYDRTDPGSVDTSVPDFAAELHAGVNRTIVGVPVNYFTEHVDPEVAAAVEEALIELVAQGAQLRDVQIPMPEYLMATELAIMLPEATSYHQRMLREEADHYTDEVRLLLEVGELVLATDYLRAQRARTLIQQQWQDLFDGIDVLIAPTVPIPAMKADTLEMVWPGGLTEGPADVYLRFSVPANLTGQPSVSVPCGFTSAGLPVGLQILGRPFDEAAVLRVANAYQSATDWATLAPPHSAA